MEVAGQWRRQWAGHAEYGKVTEGGVTRRVARAMEVLHASAPGARVRVMRAAYHSTSGPGVPASSFMLHSSRRVISSGFNILESPTSPSKPLEISSTPLEYSPDSIVETENYKVTEPDDMDISEPSKWRGTTSGNSIRMPSEESSSTDNASIIDLDSRLHRKYSYDSENSDVHSLRRNSRTSPLLDAPVTLSTLKYKSLLNNSNDWNNRRKSYSFEDTSPLNEIMVQSNDTLAMESSTDSGICKSSEIVNDYTEDTNNIKDFTGREKRFGFHRDDLADSWQFKNKPSPFYKGPKMKSYKEHDIIEEQQENNIALKSTGKVTITVPITIEGADDDKHNKYHSSDDGDRKIKRVGFCKTELHFAAESGRVNIIATDEKPPPSNDFRKRRSAFVPINDKFEKPITLFGDKSELFEKTKSDEFGIKEFSEHLEFDENTAATKSILKNKIPKPKPYLLGENMVFGNNEIVNHPPDRPVALGVSLINKELETQRITHSKETTYNYGNVTEKSFTNSLRTINKGPLANKASKAISNVGNPPNERYTSHTEPKSDSNSLRRKLNALQLSPVPKPKTRQLRESDLTFFGIGNQNSSPANNMIQQNISQNTSRTESNFADNTFESVRLIKQISSSAQNSEAESDDLPDYQNIPLKSNFAPVPIPRSRVKYKKPDEEVVLKPIIEQVYDSPKPTHGTRRSRSKKQEDSTTMTSRSRSEPAKRFERDNTIHKYKQHEITTDRSKRIMEDEAKYKDNQDIKNPKHNFLDTEEDVPVYANFKENQQEVNYNGKPRVRDLKPVEYSERTKKEKDTNSKTNISADSLERKQNNAKKSSRVHRTEKLLTPEITSTKQRSKEHSDSLKTTTSINGSINNSYKKKDHRMPSSRRISRDNESTSDSRKESKIVKRDDNVTTHPSKDKTVKKVEQSKSSKSTEEHSSDYHIHPKETRLINNEGGERGNNANSRRPSRRSEYVIKYDDKNGTVSSISKVRTGHSSSRKHASKERYKETSKDIKAKSKNIDKSALRNAAPRSPDCEWKKRR